jgi:agmatine/peptidylarginine deiminase
MTWTNVGDLSAEPEAMQLDELLERLGCRVLAILPSLLGEETGHVDLFVRFFAPDVVGVASMSPLDSADNAARLDEAVAGLRSAAAELDVQLRVVRIPMPLSEDGQLLSYLNSVRVGDRLLTPSFDSVDAETEAAIYASLADASGLEVMPIPADGPMSAGGAVHCLALGLFFPPAPAVRDPLYAEYPRAAREGLLGP